MVPGIREEVLDATGVLGVIEEFSLETTWRVCRGGESSWEVQGICEEVPDVCAGWVGVL